MSHRDGVYGSKFDEQESSSACKKGKDINMNSKEKNSLKEIENKKESIALSKILCAKSLGEVELQGKKLKRFMESVSDNSHIYGMAVSEYHCNEYYSIQKINKKLCSLEDGLTENIQKENNEINKLEEEIKKNESQKQRKN